MISVPDRFGGKAGTLATIPVTSGEVLVFQVPRTTDMMSEAYRDSAKKALNQVLPPGVEAIMIGADVDIYTICSEDATVLRLKGIL